MDSLFDCDFDMANGQPFLVHMQKLFLCAQLRLLTYFPQNDGYVESNNYYPSKGRRTDL